MGQVVAGCYMAAVEHVVRLWVNRGRQGQSEHTAVG